ncbi:MAG: NAD(P)-dependent oxidoreductase [Alphaproteobacteria bacterium]
MSRSASRVAFIGLGQMGLPMARQLRNAGLNVVGYDQSVAACELFSCDGGQTAPSIAEAMEGANFIVTMLPNGRIVQSALFSDSRNLEGVAPGALLLEMSSSAPAETRELAAKLPPGIGLVDAPVSGGVKRAIDGTLSIMAGGAQADLDDATPILEHMAAKVFRCGPVGAGHAVKAINNFVSGAGVVAAVEAIRLAQAYGLDAEIVTDVLDASSGKNNATEVKMKQFMLNGSFGSGFALGLMAKDIRTAAALSDDLGLDQACLKQTAEIWDAAAASLGGAVDHTRMFEFLRESTD